MNVSSICMVLMPRIMDRPIQNPSASLSAFLCWFYLLVFLQRWGTNAIQWNDRNNLHQLDGFHATVVCCFHSICLLLQVRHRRNLRSNVPWDPLHSTACTNDILNSDCRIRSGLLHSPLKCKPTHMTFRAVKIVWTGLKLLSSWFFCRGNTLHLKTFACRSWGLSPWCWEIWISWIVSSIHITATSRRHRMAT